MALNNLDWNKKMKVDKFRQVIRQLPAKMGNMAERHFKESFRAKGFDDNGLQRWPPRKAAGRGSLMIQSGALKRSIHRSRMTANSVTITAGDGKVPYAKIHNEGGTTHPTVTAKMIAFAYHMSKGAGTPEQAKMWRGIAHTRKNKLTVNIPQRKFMGRSKSLDRKTIEMIKHDINSIFQ